MPEITQSTFFRIKRESQEPGPKENPQRSNKKRRLKAQQFIDQQTVEDKFDLSLIMYAKPFASPKNLVAVETLRNQFKLS